MAEAESSTVARPYARSAFSCALDQREGLAEWSRVLRLLSVIVNESVVQASLDNPLLTREDQVRLLVDLVDDELLSTQARNFIEVLAENGRLGLIPTITEQYEMMKSNHEKTLDVSITSAFEVSVQNKQVLTETLAKRLQRNINLETEVDQSLIGGVLIKTEDTVIDDTVRGRLERLAQALC